MNIIKIYHQPTAEEQYFFIEDFWKNKVLRWNKKNKKRIFKTIKDHLSFEFNMSKNEKLFFEIFELECDVQNVTVLYFDAGRDTKMK